MVERGLEHAGAYVQPEDRLQAQSIKIWAIGTREKVPGGAHLRQLEAKADHALKVGAGQVEGGFFSV
jgi:hypothetical protein